MCVNYKAGMIEDYFGDGRNFGLNIEYIKEEDRMGTAGALTLLKESPTEPFIVMNGDLLTNVNFENLLDFHSIYNSTATMCVRDCSFQIPYGVVSLNGSQILAINEKPIQKFFVSAGIYVLNPSVLDFIPQNSFYDMPTLFEKLIAEKNNVISFPIHEYWLDIGRISEYEKANRDYQEVFGV
jgi:NDP-sugar pyrophosphorylase family protein